MVKDIMNTKMIKDLPDDDKTIWVKWSLVDEILQEEEQTEN